MGTRADFYVKKGEVIEWIGSISWDGYPDGLPSNLFDKDTSRKFTDKVRDFIDNRDDGTKPSEGWPWPWETSVTTDYAYVWISGHVYVSNFGSGLIRVKDYLKIESERQTMENASCYLADLDFRLDNMKALVDFPLIADVLKDRADKLRDKIEQMLEMSRRKIKFPDMSSIQKVTFGKRSGIIGLSKKD